jgi:drug/metabolite transporter (DMT)-like permease
VRISTTLKAWFDYGVMGFFNSGLAFGLIFWAQQFTDASLSAILVAASPFFTVLLAGLLLPDERFNASKIAGIMIGFAGVVLVIGPRHLSGLGENLIAELVLLLAALSYAISSVWGRRFASEDPLATSAGQLTASAALMLPLALIFESPLQTAMPSLTVIGSVIALATLSTALAYIVFFRILKMAGATNTTMVGMLIPVFTMLFAVPILGETISLLKITGMMVIAIGMMVLDGRPVKALAKGFNRA